MTLFESRNRIFLLLKHFEKVEQPDHLQGLERKLCRIQQLHVSSLLLRGGHVPHQQADAAGIDHADIRQVENPATRAIGQQVV